MADKIVTLYRAETQYQVHDGRIEARVLEAPARETEKMFILTNRRHNHLDTWRTQWNKATMKYDGVFLTRKEALEDGLKRAESRREKHQMGLHRAIDDIAALRALLDEV